MTVQVFNGDGTVSDLGCIYWHPECVKTAEQNIQTRHHASLWTTKSKVLNHYRRINETRAKLGLVERDLVFVIDNIEYASAPIEIYDDCEDGQPWRHSGLLLRQVEYGGTDFFWKDHA